MPAITTSYSVSEEIEDKIDEKLLAIMNRCQARATLGRPTKTREEELEDAIGRLAMSSLREEKQKFSVEYLKRGLRSIGCIRDAKDVAQALGTMCRFRIPTILSVLVAPELKNGEAKYVLAISTGSLGLPDMRYYAATAPGKTDVLFAYTKLCRAVCGILDIDDVSQIIPLEGEMSSYLAKTGKDDAVYYSSGKALAAAFPGFEWKVFFDSYGIPFESIGLIRVDSKPWLSYIGKLLAKTALADLYSLFVLHTFLHALPYLPPPFDDWYFEFFEKRLRGQEEKLPQKELTLQILKTTFSYALDYFFVKENLNSAFKSNAARFVRHILTAAANRVRNIKWLGEKARERAAKKLLGMQTSVAWAQEGIDHPRAPPLLQTDNLLANVYLLEAATTEELLRRHALGRVNVERVWDEPAFTVNAYYYHETNQITVPAGSFATPFFKDGAQEHLGWNFGGLGAIVAHEITHAFDEDGKEFNEKGEEKVWWSPLDKKKYTEKTKELIRLFDSAKVMGRQVNGTATLSENLADLGGLGIALDALKGELERLKVGEAERKRQLRDFFWSYAVSWRTKERPERTLQRLFMDRHAPVELRVNLIVIQFDEWYEAFDIRTADAMYIPPEERIRIF